MDMKRIKELMAAMEKGGIKKLAIKDTGGFEIQLERYDATVGSHGVREVDVIHRTAPHPQSTPLKTHEKPAQEKHSGKYVTSPMVGTFYTAASPDDPPFVKVGDRVEENTVVCIIEAMKVMNEVKAGVSGTVAEILIDNAHPVEFGSKLVRIT